MTSRNSLRLLFFGTPDFAVPALRALALSQHDVVGVVSQPDRPRGRGRKLEPTPVKAEALLHDLPVLQPDKVGAPEVIDWMRELRPDLGIVVAFGQFVPKRVRELPPHRLINAHASLLPRHRGAAPIQYALLSGDARTGVSVMRLEKEMDAGDTCLIAETPIGAEETAGELFERLAELAAEALLTAVDAIAEGTARFTPQDAAAVTLAPKLTKDFGKIDWREPAERVMNRIRAVTPWPGADLMLRKSAVRLRILEARRSPEGPPPEQPGALDVQGGELRVGALDGWIQVRKIQKPGGRPMLAADYLRGAPLPEGEEAESE